MTTDEYLKTCTNVPALPSGWCWRLTTTREDRKLLTREGTEDYTYIYIEITDRDGKVRGTHRVMFPTRNAIKYPDSVGIELAQGCRVAYGRLYSELKLDFYKALNIDPT